jgi:hypothetical protein
VPRRAARLAHGRGARAHGAELDAAVLGAGEIAVVLANQSGNDPCVWMSLARELAGKAMRTLVFRYDDPAAPTASCSPRHAPVPPGHAGARQAHPDGARRRPWGRSALGLERAARARRDRRAPSANAR